jgi:hypothetical protein
MMTIIDEISICANQLANAGNKPTVALIKAKLTQRVPLVTIINTLKNWQHQPDFILPKEKQQQKVSTNTAKNNKSELIEFFFENDTIKLMIKQSVDEELSGMKKELSDMKLIIQNLTEQLDQSK